MPVNKELLKILACPACHGKVKLNAKKDKLVCTKCKAIYEIEDDIPIMLIKEKEVKDVSKRKDNSKG